MELLPLSRFSMPLLFCVVQVATGSFWSRSERMDMCVPPAVEINIQPWMPLDTLTPLFVDVSFPSSVVVGETFPVQISAYNNLTTSLPVTIQMEGSLKYSVSGNPCSVCIPAGQKFSTAISILAVDGGSENLIINANIEDESATGPCRPDIAVSKRYRIASPIKIAFEGFLIERTWNKYICTYDTNDPFIPLWGVTVPRNVVRNSAHAWITVTGDLLGHSLENLGQLIRYPSGCGEQSMSRHAPNIYILKYLNASNQVTPEVAERLIVFIKIGYDHQLREYRRNDGSYAFFGGTNGSTWLTAFVVKTYAQSRIFIAVNPAELTLTTNWLKNQQLGNGCFKRVGHAHNQRMMVLTNGGLPGALAAYVMGALLEVGESPSSPVIVNAISCIEDATAPGSEGAEDIYMLALKAYAYSLAGLPEAEGVIGELFGMASENADGIFWWMRNVNGFENEALSVETTSYVLLAILTLNLADTHAESRKIVKWISSMMNARGGFLSTQDTVLALQALAEFETHEAQEPFDLNITIHGASIRPKELQITESNKLQAQRVDVELLPTYLSAFVAGSGCALIQAALRYNIKDPQPSEVFSLKVTTVPDYKAEKCPTFRIQICVAYHLVNFQSNMGIVEVDLVSGHVANTDDLNRIGVIERYEMDGSKLTFYFRQFTPEETCIEFLVSRESEVRNARPGTVVVYDYYDNGFQVNQILPFPRTFCPSTTGVTSTSVGSLT